MAKGPRQKVSTADLPEHIRTVASVPGTTTCLRCRKKFKSADATRLRICGRCGSINDAIFVKAELEVQCDVSALY